MGIKRKTLKREIALSLLGIIFASGIISFLTMYSLSLKSFDALVERRDVEVARTFAEQLGASYAARGSWQGIELMVRLLSEAQGPTELRTELGETTRGGRDGKRRDDVIPLVVTDDKGLSLFPDQASAASRGLPLRHSVVNGVPIESEGSVVGYVYFKSMLSRSYSAHEKEFLSSLGMTILISVLAGSLLSLGLSFLFSVRFLAPLSDLELAVRNIAGGQKGVRSGIHRRDEIGSLAENFNVMAERLEMNERERKNLLADMAHELRTPVSVIRGNLEMIISGVYSADRQRLESLLDETRILSDLISALRDISDLELGSLSFNPVEIDATSFLKETAERYGPLLFEKGITLVLQDESQSARAYFDPDRLRQVMRNVFFNAMKYAPGDTAVLFYCRLIEPKDGERYLRFAIEDRGPGVPDADLLRIFDRFYRVDPSRNRDSGGRGLGLSICKGIMETGGGAIFAENAIPQGLRVCVDVPVGIKREK